MDDYISLWGAIYGIIVIAASIIIKMRDFKTDLSKIRIREVKNVNPLKIEEMDDEPYQWANIILTLFIKNSLLQHALFRYIGNMFKNTIDISDFQILTDHIHPVSIGNLKRKNRQYMIDTTFTGITIQGIAHIKISDLFSISTKISINWKEFHGHIQINADEQNVIEISLDKDFTADIMVDIQLESDFDEYYPEYDDVDDVTMLDTNLGRWLEKRILEIIDRLKCPNGIQIILSEVFASQATQPSPNFPRSG